MSTLRERTATRGPAPGVLVSRRRCGRVADPRTGECAAGRASRRTGPRAAPVRRHDVTAAGVERQRGVTHGPAGVNDTAEAFGP